MIFKNIYKLILATIVIFFVDLFWLLTGGKYALPIAEKIQGSKISMNYYSAIFVYLFLAYMLLKTNTYSEAFLFGICIYGVYDFTTLSIFKNYDYRFAIFDTLWGGILFFVSKSIISRF
jgi:uncharacterized membrane protein